MELSSKHQAEPERKNFPLRLGFGISAVWLILFFIYLFRNFSEISALAPNNLGDFLAGVFAPLAFLWLFVATLLQRQELQLQRQELAETREVMALQKAEMARAADENSEQTKIMKENLQSENSQQIYNEVDIRLYALALYITANWSKSRVGPPLENRYIINIGTLPDAVNKDNSDRVFLLTNRSLAYFAKTTGGTSVQISTECGAFIDYCRDELRSICTDKKYSTNDLAKTRVSSLGLHECFSLASSIRPGP